MAEEEPPDGEVLIEEKGEGEGVDIVLGEDVDEESSLLLLLFEPDEEPPPKRPPKTILDSCL